MAKAMALRSLIQAKDLIVVKAVALESEWVSQKKAKRERKRQWSV